jgi:hypothetical protein
VYRLAGHVPVDERLRQALGGDRGRVEPREPQRQRERARRGIRAHLDPRADPAQLVARALDEDAVRLQPRAMRAHAPATSPSSYCRSTLNARITAGRRAPKSPGSGTSNPPRAKDTRASGANGRASRAHLVELRSRARRAPGRSRGPRPRRRGAPAQPRLELERRHAARAVAEVDDERIRRASQHRVPRDPAVDAAQAVRVGGAARDLPDTAAAAAAARGGFSGVIPHDASARSVG